MLVCTVFLVALMAVLEYCYCVWYMLMPTAMVTKRFARLCKVSQSLQADTGALRPSWYRPHSHDVQSQHPQAHSRGRNEDDTEQAGGRQQNARQHECGESTAELFFL